MVILIVNCGSSSIKYKLYESSRWQLLSKGTIEKIGEAGSPVKDHSQGIETILGQIVSSGAIKSLDEIAAVGHRVVHGAEAFTQPHIINAQVLKKIKECARLAPLHNPVNSAGIMGCKKLLPRVPQVAVFDTAFHQTMPPRAYHYPLPLKFYKKYKVRKYGFHGSSHQFVSEEAARRLKKPLAKLNLITCHLGNGCSIAAIEAGKTIDTSMGFTPLEGLMMGTRCGDIDVAAVFYLMSKENISPDRMDSILNKESGFLGVSGISNDLRVIMAAIDKGDQRARLAYDMFVYRLKKYIGAYCFVLGKVDAICLTGGIGENNAAIRLDIERQVCRVYGEGVKVLVIPTDEELMIASLTQGLLRSSKRKTGAKR